MREIWLMQPRFDKRVGNGPFTLVDQPRFRAGFDFLRLRAQVGEVEEELAHWWETFQNVSDVMREDMVDAQRKDGPGKSGAGKARRVKRSDTDQPANAAGTPHEDQRSRGVDADEVPAPSPAPARSYGSAFAPDEEDADDTETGGGDAGSETAAAAPAKKRRRRRRKPSGGGGVDGGSGEGGPAPTAD
jgi:poly(A) polymerase